MLRNLIKASIRSIMQYKGYSSLNILGLTLGITCTLLISMYIFDELSYDKFHTNRERIYRVISTFVESGKETNYSTTQIPLAEELESKYSEIAYSVRLLKSDRELFTNPVTEQRYYEEGFYYADPTLFKVFDFPLLHGDPNTALNESNTIILTKSAAIKYFGSEDIIGRQLENKGNLYNVTGVMEDLPSNSHITFDALISFSSFPREFSSWDSWFTSTYVLVKEGTTINNIERSLEQIRVEHVEPKFSKFNLEVKYWAQPLSSIYLETDFGDQAGESGDMSYIYIFIAIALFILTIAIINYINLATAQASRRAKEIGVRKTMGSGKKQIIFQFITESTLLTLLSFMLSLLCVILFLPYFNELADKTMLIVDLVQPKIILTSALIVLLVGIVGGSYPAFYLSQFNPVDVLKGSLTQGAANGRLRKTLVILQFVIAVIMLICTSVVYDQLVFLNNKDLGFDYTQVLTIPMPDENIRTKSDVLINEIKNRADVIEASSSSSTPGKDLFYAIMKVDGPAGLVSKGVNFCFAGFGFTESLGIPVIKGRSFSKDFISDSTAALVNQSMVKSMGWLDPIGKKLTFDDGNPETMETTYTVVGIINDFHQHSLHNVIKPLAIFQGKGNYYLNVKVSTANLQTTIKAIEDAWGNMNNDKPFSYSFLDDDFRIQYENDQKRGEIFTLFTIIIIIISCIGLIGLASYTTERRAREIGIRKVIGADITDIVKMMFREFIWLISISLIIAFPLAYYFMNKWLQTFAYQTSFSWINCIVAALIIIIVTVSSIGFHTLKAARINPVKIIKEK